MSAKGDDLYAYVQERCLWQFASRTWDRTANLDGVLGMGLDLLTGKPVKAETPDERLFYADAVVMVADFKTRFPWLAETKPEELQSLIQELKERLVEITITKSKNRELNHQLY